MTFGRHGHFRRAIITTVHHHRLRPDMAAAAKVVEAQSIPRRHPFHHATTRTTQLRVRL